MMTLKVYENCKILPNKNFIVEDIDYYLSSLTAMTHDISFAKLEYETEVVVPVADTYLEQFKNELYAFNYVSVTFENEVSGVIVNYYYFIEDIKWSSQLGLYLKLKMDILNTYKEDVDFKLSHRCRINRRHFNRISSYDEELGKYIFNIHRLSEGIQIPMLKKAEENIYQDTDNTALKYAEWYLVYKSISDEDSAVNVYLIPNRRIRISTGTEVLLINSDTPNGLYQIPCAVNGYGSITATFGETSINGKYDIQVAKTSSSITVAYKPFDSDTPVTVDQIDSISIRGIQVYQYTTSVTQVTLPQILKNITTIQYDGFGLNYINTLSIDDIDRTDSLIQQIIKLPYCPVNFTWRDAVSDSILAGINLYNTGFIASTGNEQFYSADGEPVRYLKLIDLTKEFLNTLALPSNMNLSYEDLLLKTINANSLSSLSKYNVKEYETKLLHSDYFYTKFVYDQFNLVLRSELGQFPTGVSFKASNTGNSNFLFRINGISDQEEETDYPMLVLSNKNTNIPIYNSAYLNYIRYGYNYDKKARTTSEIAGWVNTGLSTAGGIASLFAGGLGILPATMFGLSAAQSFTQNIIQMAQNENTMKSKLAQSALQGFEINGSNDVDLYDYYTDNKAKFVQYQVDNHFVDELFNLFYYTGYCSNETIKPEHNVRHNFDYLEAVVEFDEIGRIPLEVIDLIKEKYNQGVYYLHKNYFSYQLPDGTSYQSEYDFELLSSNFENILYE